MSMMMIENIILTLCMPRLMTLGESCLPAGSPNIGYNQLIEQAELNEAELHNKNLALVTIVTKARFWQERLNYSR